MKQEEQLQAVKQFAKEKLGQDQTGHGMDHLERVVRMARRLAISEGVDPFLPMVGAYLHDTIDEKLVDSVAQAKEELASFLLGIDFNQQQVDQLVEVLGNISFARTLEDKPLELPLLGKIIRDADWLDAIGALGISRAIYYGGAHHEKIYDPAVKPRQNMSREEYRNLADETIINHFSEKLLHLESMMSTASAKKIAAHRQQVMLDFLTKFHAEWDAKK